VESTAVVAAVAVAVRWGKIMEYGNNTNSSEAWNTVPITAESVLSLYGAEVSGLKSACGVVIGDLGVRAATRIVERRMTLLTFVDTIKNAPIIYPVRKPHRICQQKDSWKIVIDRNTGDIVTVVKLDD
jgi:hypothetical protein